MHRVSSYQELKTGHLQQSQNLQKELNRCFDTRTQCGRTHTSLLKIVVNVADDKLRMGLSTILHRFGLIWINTFKRDTRHSYENNLKTTEIILSAMIITGLIFSVMLVTTKSQVSFGTSSNVQTFMNMTEEQRIHVAQNMTQDEKQMVMNKFSKQNSTVYENMSDAMTQPNTEPLMGNFIDAGDGFHKAEGIAKVIDLTDGRTFLRLENLKTTNGPDLYVYLSTGKDVSDIVNLGRLKGNIGNQNYEIPIGTDLSKYNTVLIWCKAFSTLFGSAQLTI